MTCQLQDVVLNSLLQSMALALTQASDEFVFTRFETRRNFIALDFKNLQNFNFFFCTQLSKGQRMKKKIPKFAFFTAFPFFLSLSSLR